MALGRWWGSRRLCLLLLRRWPPLRALPRTLPRRGIGWLSLRRLRADLQSRRLTTLLCKAPISWCSSIWHWRPASNNFKRTTMSLSASLMHSKRALGRRRRKLRSPLVRRNASSWS